VYQAGARLDHRPEQDDLKPHLKRPRSAQHVRHTERLGHHRPYRRSELAAGAVPAGDDDGLKDEAGQQVAPKKPST
jgi:hypothetical protein